MAERGSSEGVQVEQPMRSATRVPVHAYRGRRAAIRARRPGGVVEPSSVGCTSAPGESAGSATAGSLPPVTRPVPADGDGAYPTTSAVSPLSTARIAADHGDSARCARIEWPRHRRRNDGVPRRVWKWPGPLVDALVLPVLHLDLP